MRRLVVIPARGGSKRIPDKNIKDFCGQPMIAHAVRIAQKSNVFDTIHVSSDSEAIAQAAADCGAVPDFKRPDDLSGDHTSMMEVMKYVVEEYQRRGQVFDTVALLYATSPLANPDDLSGACLRLEKSAERRPVLAVATYPAPIEHAFRLSENGRLSPNDAQALAMRTQDLQHAYYDAGMFAVYTPETITGSQGGGDFNAFDGYAVPAHRVTDIDWPEDWVRAEMLYRAIHGL